MTPGRLPNPSILRFSPLVRDGLRFRKRFEQARQGCPDAIAWYPFDSFANLFPMQALMSRAGLSFRRLVSQGKLLDLGCGDGALSFFAESLGATVDAVDHSRTNMNAMAGIRWLAGALGSRVNIVDRDIDAVSGTAGGPYGLALCLGILYHLKNPFACLENLARQSRRCLVSTRIMHRLPGSDVSIAAAPVAYLLDSGEVSGDVTNYWIFSEAGVARLVDRCGWDLLSWIATGDPQAEPTGSEHDGRLFALLKSRLCQDSPK